MPQKSMDEYNIFEPAREIREFVADFSQWYIRRSRDRFKVEGEDKENALATTRYVLLELFKTYVATYSVYRGASLPESEKY